MDALFVEKQKTGDNMKKAISTILIILAVSLMIVNFAFAIKYLGEDGDVDRLDQTVFSVILERFFSDVKVFAVT